MTEEEARTLADRIIATWPAGAKHYIWKRRLLALEDYRTADATYELMVDTETATPTVGKFVTTYHQQYTRLHQPPQPDIDAPTVIDLAEFLRRVQDRPIDGGEHLLKLNARRRHPSALIEQEPF